jgi:hypothetical protein
LHYILNATENSMSKAAKKAKAAPRQHQRQPGSMADQIDRLAIGQSVAVAERFQVGKASTTATHILDALKKMRSGQAAYVARITDDLDTREFAVESGTFITEDKTAMVAVVTVTRVG